MNGITHVLVLTLTTSYFQIFGQQHPEIYITNAEKEFFKHRWSSSPRVQAFVLALKEEVTPAVSRHVTDPQWMVSRLQLYWKTKYRRVFVNGMDFAHGEGEAPVPTVRFSGSRDWATDYLRPALDDVLPFMDDPRGLYLQNGKKKGQPWEWVQPSETGHIIERINEEILGLAADAAFLYWLEGDDKYAVFAADVFMKYIEGMYHREPPATVGDDKNALLMGLQTFEVIHERIVEPVALCYDFLYHYLAEKGKDVTMVQEVFRRWADQEIKYGVPDNNWNLMQARYIAYLAFALEHDSLYADGKGQEYYINQILHQNSAKQKALRDVVKNFDPITAIWPEVAHYSIMVSDDLIEIFSILDKTLNNHLLERYPILEKAILANFHYLFPNDFTVAYGDAKHARLRFNALELLIAQYRKYGQKDKEDMMTGQLRRSMEIGAYNRGTIKSLFQLFFYVEELTNIPAAPSFAPLVSPTFYSPNVSWIVQRNWQSAEQGMMVSKNASLGNHSHTNGINIELFAKGMAIVPDAAAGVSYWTDDHKEYYSRFPAHNTVVVDGVSDYRNMRGAQAFTVHGIYPKLESKEQWDTDYTYSDVSFHEISTDAAQQRLTGTVRTGNSSGFFVDIFRSVRNDKNDKKHEYILHGQGEPVHVRDFQGNRIGTSGTDELGSKYGDQVGYDYLFDKKKVDYTDNFTAQFSLSSKMSDNLTMQVWMKGEEDRSVFTVMAPYSRAIHPESVPATYYKSPSPTLVVQQRGEAHTRPFVAIIDVFDDADQVKVEQVTYFSDLENATDFIGIAVKSGTRTDYIYNDVNIGNMSSFRDGQFVGTYALVTSEHESIRALLLGSGRILEKESWRIETQEAGSSVLISLQEKGLSMDASHPFILRMPMPANVEHTSSLRLKDKTSGKLVMGRQLDVGSKKCVEFSLPVLQNRYFEIMVD